MCAKAAVRGEFSAGDLASLLPLRRIVMPAKKGLYANIHAKKERIAHGSGEKMRKPGSKGAPKAAAFKRAAKTARSKKAA